MQLRRELRAETFDFTDFLHARRAQTIDAAEMREQRRTADAPESFEIVEHALADFFRAELCIVGVRETMRLVAEALQQIQARMIEGEIQRRTLVGKNDRLVFLRESDERRRFQLEAHERF